MEGFSEFGKALVELASLSTVGHVAWATLLGIFVGSLPGLTECCSGQVADLSRGRWPSSRKQQKYVAHSFIRSGFMIERQPSDAGFSDAEVGG